MRLEFNEIMASSSMVFGEQFIEQFTLEGIMNNLNTQLWMNKSMVDFIYIFITSHECVGISVVNVLINR